MEVSAIMNIYELAANKRVKTRENLPEKGLPVSLILNSGG